MRKQATRGVAASAASPHHQFDTAVLDAEKSSGMPYPVWAAGQRAGIKTHWWQLWKSAAEKIDDSVEAYLAAMKTRDAVVKASEAPLSPPIIFPTQ